MVLFTVTTRRSESWFRFHCRFIRLYPFIRVFSVISILVKFGFMLNKPIFRPMIAWVTTLLRDIIFVVGQSIPDFLITYRH